MNRYTLGLDIGPTSIGWAMIDDDVGTPPTAGVRIFPEGVKREKGDAEVSRNADRRLARAIRRQIARRAARCRRVRDILQQAGFWGDDAARAIIDPLQARRRGLDHPLSPAELGAALAHMAKRRGFKSNRKLATDKEDGPVLKEIAALQRELDAAGSRTLGEYLAVIRDDPHARVRMRRTLRAMYEHEFEVLTKKQAEFHPSLVAPYAGLDGATPRDRLRDALFFQRKLHPVSRGRVGRCPLEPRERRCPSGHRVAQRFRIVKEVNTLRVADGLGIERALTPDERAAVITLLCSSQKEKVTFNEIRKLLGFHENQRFNLERGERDSLKHHASDAELRKGGKNATFGRRWDTLPEADRDEIVAALLESESAEELQRLGEHHGLDAEAARRFALLQLDRRPVRLSRKAMSRLLPAMEEGAREDEAAAAFAEYERIDGPVLDRLPPPPEELRNPIVRAALFQLRRLVGAITREHGKPAAIHVELAREAKGSPADRKRRSVEMAGRRRQREAAADELRSAFGLARPSRADLERYLLWKEQHEACPYTGDRIGLAELLGPDVEIDHIIPYDRCLDDSFANLALCRAHANRDKGNRTPHEWLADRDPDRYEAMLHRVEPLARDGGRGKARRFAQQHAAPDDFLARQLNDTAYIAREVASYLRRLGVPVVCVRGGTTAELRYRWGLDTVLRDDGLALKNRDDHRHHAVDAVVIALTTPRHLQALAKAGKRRRRTGEEDGGVVLPPPHDGFRDEVAAVVRAINVSHRPRRGVGGALHEDTFYGKTEVPGTFVHRKPLGALTPAMVEKIRDPAIRRIVETRLREHGVEPGSKAAIPSAAWSQPLLMPSGVPIRKVRVLKEDGTIVPIRGGAAHVKTGSNHHVCIFAFTDDKGREKRESVFVSRLEAARRLRLRQPVVVRTHPTRPDARFVLCMCPGDTVLMDVTPEGENEKVERLMIFRSGTSTQGQLYFKDCTDARRDDDVPKGDKPSAKMAGTLKARRVSVDLLGRIRDVDRRPAGGQAHDRGQP